MTTEEKAKAYDEALERAKDCLTDRKFSETEDTLRSVMEYIFPELAESENEDEKARKFLVQHISEWIGCIEHDLKISSKDIESEKELAMFKAGLAYLEKQKEQKHPNGCFTCDEYKKGYEEGRRNGFTEGYNKAMKEVEQKEQKPELPLMGGDTDTYFDDLRMTTKSLTSREWFNEGIKYAQRLQKEQHPSSKFLPGDWLVYDGPLGHAILQVKDVIDGRYTFVNNDSTLLVEDSDKFLRPLTPKDVEKPAEWSKEDEEMLTELLLTIEPSNNYDEMRNWLLLKLKALLLQGSKDSLQTSWKPSEEQMSMLLAVINDPNNAGAESCYMALKSIYNNLKKL